MRNKVIEVFAHAGDSFESSNDPDRMLYSGGFIPPADRHLLNAVADSGMRFRRGGDRLDDRGTRYLHGRRVAGPIIVLRTVRMSRVAGPGDDSGSLDPQLIVRR